MHRRLLEKALALTLTLPLTLTLTLTLARLIILESVAGVPGMLGGMFRHFRSLRQLERDHGE